MISAGAYAGPASEPLGPTGAGAPRVEPRPATDQGSRVSVTGMVSRGMCISPVIVSASITLPT